MALDTASVQLAIGASFQNLPSTLLAPGAFVRVHVGVAGVDTATDLFAPALGAPDPAADSVALYDASANPPPPLFFDDPANVVDFVQWGAPNQPFASIAQTGGVWFFADTFVPAPAVGQALAWDGQGKQPSDWFRDASPTLGGPNVQPSADVTHFGFQCSPAAFGPMLNASSPPALGNVDFAIDLLTQSLGQPAILFLGTSTVSIPVLGGSCLFHAGGVFTQIPFTTPPSGAVSFPFPLPTSPVLIGLQFVAQAAVVNGFGLPAPFPGIDLSGALVVQI